MMDVHSFLTYRKKRHFHRTPEPSGKKSKGTKSG